MQSHDKHIAMTHARSGAIGAITAILSCMAWLLVAMLAVNITLAQSNENDAPTTQPAKEKSPDKGDDAKTPTDANEAADAAEPAPAQPIVDQQAIKLRPAYVAGRVTRYSFWTIRQQQAVVQVGGESQEASTVMEFKGEGTWTVSKVHNDGSATCIFTYDHLTATITQPDGQSQVIDSRRNQSDNPQVLRFFQSLVGVPISYEMAADGSATAVSGTQVITQRLGEDLAAMAPAEEEHLETASELATLPATPQTLAVGGTWKTRFDWKHEVGRLIMPMTYELASVEVIAGIPVAMVNFTAQPQIKPDYSKIPANGPKVDIQQTQASYQGQTMFDLQRHEVAGFNASRLIALNIRITLPQGQTLVRQVTEKTQNQLLRIEESQ